MPSFHDFRFLSTDGKHNVFARECTPDGEVRAVLQIAHGVAEHIYRYAPFMEFLAENGFVVVANDHLGHGKTAENEQELCFFAEKDGWNDVVSDMDTLHKLTAAKYPGVPYFLFGHSMGGYAVCSVLDGSGADAAVSIGGVNSAMEATISGVYHYFGRLAFLHYPFLYLYQTLRFGRTAVLRQAIDGAKHARALLLVNGVNDWIAPLDRASVVSHIGTLHGQDVQCLLWGEEGRDGHADLLFSDRPEDANPLLMRRINAFFDDAVRVREAPQKKCQKF